VSDRDASHAAKPPRAGGKARRPKAAAHEVILASQLTHRDGSARLFADLASAVRDAGATALTMDVFGVPPAAWPAMEAAFPDRQFPVTWAAAAGTLPLGGAIVRGLVAGQVQAVRLRGHVVGAFYDDGQARHCWLGGLGPQDASAGNAEQARQALEAMEAALSQAGLTFASVVRTWLYMDDILSWYGALNTVRNTYFARHRVFDGLVPASTGIGLANPAMTAITIGAYALRPVDPQTTVRAVPSPLQCPALDYASSFSRAVLVEGPRERRLLISGTASIDAEGRTIHAGDVRAQADCTLRVVRAILVSCGMDWPRVTRGITYIRRAADRDAVNAVLSAHGMLGAPLVMTRADICPDDLLFELEVDAAEPV